ncbi:hypothetical protein [Roseateles violae]|uniref:PEGA domain-containing protein n=1 Tax=Roseateles violae TaxID=3058042 RepID=A0ABT8DUB3_9BURK|nr:hypothetical protein [Pelomonas sp. PFR6]MDN3921698.1 hypothetical protein [Pelomonas sp. PFR6]
MHRYLAQFLLILAAGLSGCATVVDGANQSIAIETSSGGRQVSGARCLLVNEFGESRVVTPAMVSVSHGHGDLTIRCQKPGFEVAENVIRPGPNMKVLGNILLGGAIGFGLDVASGAVYTYPPLISVDLIEMAEVKAASVVQPVPAIPDDEIRTVELLRRTSCTPLARPSLLDKEQGVSQYLAYCQDGRTARTVCQQSECRFKTRDDS